MKARIDLLVAAGVGAIVEFEFSGELYRGRVTVSGRYREIVERFLAIPGIAYVLREGSSIAGVYPELWDWLVARCLMLARREPFTGVEVSVPPGIPVFDGGEDRRVRY